ncbi:hypothetical protein KIN20_029429 [Parelaphostrongylus tenuis]|uniref:Uncharacterized protein n=1 Tax=Parelaphostrongylus tenuis TaxID=148309 RepID=A0AAD5R2J0_PARTN|nr:hypothetical protein KIN20_029429 [Parelaphostrongylus tenuis]
MNSMFSTSTERMESVSFIENIKSPYLTGVKYSFTQGQQERTFDLVLRHSSVAVLLYHTAMEKFLFVRQFRPAILVGHVLRQPGSFGKKLTEIDWSSYDASMDIPLNYVRD